MMRIFIGVKPKMKMMINRQAKRGVKNEVKARILIILKKFVIKILKIRKIRYK